MNKLVNLAFGLVLFLAGCGAAATTVAAAQTALQPIQHLSSGVQLHELGGHCFAVVANDGTNGGVAIVQVYEGQGVGYRPATSC